jgi:hypothetical protein
LKWRRIHLSLIGVFDVCCENLKEALESPRHAKEHDNEGSAEIDNRALKQNIESGDKGSFFAPAPIVLLGVFGAFGAV